MNKVSLTCNNDTLYRCWNCKEDCSIKCAIFLPEPLFFAFLNSLYTCSVNFMVNYGVTYKYAEQSIRIKIISIVAARIRIIGKLTLLNND